MADEKWQAKIYIKAGGPPVTVEVFAPNSMRAKQIIEAMPEFKSFYTAPWYAK